jgi:Ca2+-binding RTX toxin-like protein
MAADLVTSLPHDSAIPVVDQVLSRSTADITTVEVANTSSTEVEFGGSGSGNGNNGWIQFVDRVVGIYGTPEDDTATVGWLGFGSILVSLHNSGGSQAEAYNAADVLRVEFFGYDGADQFSNTSGEASYAEGGSGADILEGDSAADILLGQGGDDILRGNGGADQLYGGDGADILDGSDGGDTLAGEEGRDTLRGGPGADLLSGGPGDDELHGGADQDTAHGDDGNDLIWGDDGHDLLYGDRGADTIRGDNGNDEIRGGSGNDSLDGGNGADEMFGGDGHDILHGRDDADEMQGGNGNDNLYGGNGADTLYGNAGVDGLYGGNGANHLVGGGGSDRMLILDSNPQLDTYEGFDSDVDARLFFYNGEQTTFDFGGFEGDYTYAAGSWSDDDVIRVDEALAVLHQMTMNNNLLQRADGDAINFTMYGTNIDSPLGGGFFLGVNTSSGIGFFENGQFDVMPVVFHEIGHNWDGENPNWDEWLALSGWTQDAPDTPAEEAIYTHALDQDADWWYFNDADFARDYGRTNPREDFATCFQLYVMEHMGANTSGVDLSDIPLKAAFVDGFFEWLETA